MFVLSNSRIDIIVYKDLHSSDWEGVLRELSRFLHQRGYVKDTYEEAIIKREREVPTGLAVPGRINVAIPHADIEHVNKEALVINIPDKPIKFMRMDDPDSLIDVKLILLLVIKNPDGYVKFLSKLTELFQDDKFVELVNKKDYDGLVEYIREKALVAMEQG